LTLYVSKKLKLVDIDAYNSVNLVARISSIEVSPTDRLWHICDAQRMSPMSENPTVKGVELNYSLCSNYKLLSINVTDPIDYQTILLLLAMADTGSQVTFEGGTHNGMSPSVTFLEQSFLPVLAQMELETVVNVEQLGFYPAGGGKWTLDIKPCKHLRHFDLLECQQPEISLADAVKVTAIVIQLPENIGQREIDTVVKLLDLNPQAASS
jgi:hypothetical protein